MAIDFRLYTYVDCRYLRISVIENSGLAGPKRVNILLS